MKGRSMPASSLRMSPSVMAREVAAHELREGERVAVGPFNHGHAPPPRERHTPTRLSTPSKS